MKPPFAYFGGKTTLAEQIASLLPDHEHYVEPFAGSLAVLLAKHPSKVETINDLDGDIVTFWRVLRDRPEDLIRVAEFTPHARAEIVAAFEDSDDDLERARRTWVKLTQGRGSSLRRSGWRYRIRPEGNGMSVAGYLAAYVDRMPPAAERLRFVSIENRPALELVALYGQTAEVCLYVDPPYEGVTRPNSSDGYRCEMGATDDHRALLLALLGCSASVVLSGYRSSLYDELLGAWDFVEVATYTGHASTPADRTEVIWCNRPLHDGRLAGIA